MRRKIANRSNTTYFEREYNFRDDMIHVFDVIQRFKIVTCVRKREIVFKNVK